ncbi:MAG TPA: ECF transporter S component [Firmicutes bacterium]|nr:ECF transporter S component [Bacillota bacterium]
MRSNALRSIMVGAILTAMSLIIPLAFGGVLGVFIPPFSATIASHVPVMVAMLLGPWVAVVVGLGSALGFLLRLGPVIAARAAVHAVFGLVGGMLLQKGMSFAATLAFVAPIHAVLEALVVIPFGFSVYQFLVVVGVGTLLHHCIDAAIAAGLVAALARSGLGRLLAGGRHARVSSKHSGGTSGARPTS